MRCSPSLSKLIGGLSRDARSIPVSGLSDSEVTKFVEFRAGQRPDDTLVAKLCAATNGNPLFVDGIRSSGSFPSSEGGAGEVDDLRASGRTVDDFKLSFFGALGARRER